MDGVVMARKTIVEKEKSPKDALFEQALADFRMAEEAWADNRTKALDDIKFRRVVAATPAATDVAPTTTM